MSPHPKELAALTSTEFVKHVPSAILAEEAVYELTPPGGKAGRIRLKRAAQLANQVHVGRGEPLVLHVPGDAGDEWFVVPVLWQLQCARANARTANQHASHAFDCMMFSPAILPQNLKVTPNALKAACETAITEAQNPVLRVMLKAIDRARNAVADVLIETIEEEFDI